jgi:hypothetical protein
MAVVTLPSTLDHGYTPLCSECGIHLCWDISEEEYEERQAFWDNWRCQECNGGQRMQRPAGALRITG